MIVLNLDRATAGHLAVAIRRHRKALKRTGRACPAGLGDLEELAVRTVRSGHGRTGTDTAPVADAERAYADRNGHEYLSYAEVAALLRVDERTVRRRVNAGDLRVIPFGRARRIRRSDLEGFLRRDEYTSEKPDLDPRCPGW